MFSYERRRETKPAFKDGMCDLRNGCCGCFIPYFPYRQFLEQVETSEMLFDLCQILLYTHTLAVRPSNTWVRLLLCQRGTFSEAITPGVVLKMCWQLIGWTRWLSCISPGVILYYVKAPYCTLIRGLLSILFPVFVNGPISTFQIVQLSSGAFSN